MKNKLLKILLISFIIIFMFTGCTKTITVNFENEQELNSSNIGKESLVEIGGFLYYDSATRIVYWWNGALDATKSSTAPTPYYAPNGLPYKYNPETNTFEEIKGE